jgi:hypothetical protein
MQPVQLSLIPEPVPAPPAPPEGPPVEAFPADAVAAATALLAGVIAKAAAPSGMEAAGDE